MDLSSRLVRFLRKGREENKGETPFWNELLLILGGVMLWEGLFEGHSTVAAILGAAAVLLAVLWQVSHSGFEKTLRYLGTAAIGGAIAVLLFVGSDWLGWSWLPTVFLGVMVAAGIIFAVVDAFDWLTGRL